MSAEQTVVPDGHHCGDHADLYDAEHVNEDPGAAITWWRCLYCDRRWRTYFGGCDVDEPPTDAVFYRNQTPW